MVISFYGGSLLHHFFPDNSTFSCLWDLRYGLRLIFFISIYSCSALGIFQNSSSLLFKHIWTQHSSPLKAVFPLCQLTLPTFLINLKIGFFLAFHGTALRVCLERLSQMTLKRLLKMLLLNTEFAFLYAQPCILHSQRDSLQFGWTKSILLNHDQLSTQSISLSMNNPYHPYLLACAFLSAMT